MFLLNVAHLIDKYHLIDQTTKEHADNEDVIGGITEDVFYVQKDQKEGTKILKT